MGCLRCGLGSSSAPVMCYIYVMLLILSRNVLGPGVHNRPRIVLSTSPSFFSYCVRNCDFTWCPSDAMMHISVSVLEVACYICFNAKKTKHEK